MKKIEKFAIFTIVFLIGFGFLNYFMRISMGRLPKGEWLYAVVSPSEQYTVNVYIVEEQSRGIRCELEDLTAQRLNKTIFWDEKAEAASVKWLNDHFVIINGVILDVRTDVYDERA